MVQIMTKAQNFHILLKTTMYNFLDRFELFDFRLIEAWFRPWEARRHPQN